MIYLLFWECCGIWTCLFLIWTLTNSYLGIWVFKVKVGGERHSGNPDIQWHGWHLLFMTFLWRGADQLIEQISVFSKPHISQALAHWLTCSPISCQLIGFDWLTTADRLPVRGGGGAALLLDMKQEQKLSKISAEVTWSSISCVRGLFFLFVPNQTRVVWSSDRLTEFQLLCLSFFPSWMCWCSQGQ